MNEYRIKVLGRKAIIEALENGAELYYVPGKFGGWGITVNLAEVRKDSVNKLMMDGMLKTKERTSHCTTYVLK